MLVPAICQKLLFIGCPLKDTELLMSLKILDVHQPETWRFTPAPRTPPSLAVSHPSSVTPLAACPKETCDPQSRLSSGGEGKQASFNPGDAKKWQLGKEGQAELTGSSLGAPLVSGVQ